MDSGFFVVPIRFRALHGSTVRKGVCLTAWLGTPNRIPSVSKEYSMSLTDTAVKKAKPRDKLNTHSI
jgi:hypothetical protein